MAELAQERRRLEGRSSGREAELLKKLEADRLALQEAWEKKQAEWLAEHQAALQEAEAVAHAENQGIGRDSGRPARSRSRRNTGLRQADLAGSFAAREKALQQKLAEKEKDIDKQVQAQLPRPSGAPEAVRRARQAPGGRTPASKDAPRRTPAELEDHYQKAKATLVQDFLAKEKESDAGLDAQGKTAGRTVPAVARPGTPGAEGRARKAGPGTRRTARKRRGRTSSAQTERSRPHKPRRWPSGIG